MKKEQFENTIKLTLEYFSELYLNGNLKGAFFEDLSWISHLAKKTNKALEDLRLSPDVMRGHLELVEDRLKPIRLEFVEIKSLCIRNEISYQFFGIKEPYQNKYYSRFWIKKLNNCLQEITYLIIT